MTGKILITGADGFIGSHLVEFLLQEKEPLEKLRLFVLPGNDLDNLPEKKFDIFYGDIRDKKATKKAMEGVSTVYHLAAMTSFASNDYKDYKEVNVDGTENLLQACKGKPMQKFVFFSTIAVYGLPAWTGDIINWDESHPKSYSDIYGKSKFEAEKRVLHAADEWNIPYAIVRPSSVYGPRDRGQLYGMYKAIKNHYFFRIGSGENKMHFVFVKDLVKGARQMQLLKSRASDAILAGENPTKFKDVVRYIADSIDRHPPNFHIPKAFGLLLSYAMESTGNIIGVRSPLFPDRVKVMTTNYYYKINKARKEFNYDPKTTFQEGAQITGKWYLDHNWL